MANVYIRSGAGGAGTGADWANAYTTLAAALAAKAAGDDFWIADDHAESQASTLTLTSPGTAASWCRIFCVDHTGSVPPVPADLRTTATITTTGASAINTAGFAYVQGVTFNCGSGNNFANVNFTSTSAWHWRLDNCAINLVNTSGSSRIVCGNNGGTVNQFLELINTTVSFGSTSQGIVPRCRVEWSKTASAVTGATIPTALILTGGSVTSFTAIGVDLSALGSSKSWVDVTGNQTGTIRFLDCKAGASVSFTTGTMVSDGLSVEVTNSDYADTNYRVQRTTYRGTITNETTIVRTGGASDGTTAFSRKLVTTANSKWFAPLESRWFYFWNEATGSPITVEIETITDGVTLTDAECGIVLEALTTSGYPLGGFATDLTADTLATGTNQTTSSESWTTTGLSSPVTQVLSANITPQEKGWIRARVHLAKPSTTVYVCPKVKANTTQYMTESGDIINVPTSSGGGIAVPTMLFGSEDLRIG